MIRALLLTLAVLLGGTFATPARAWWNGDWPYRVKIDADLGPKGANVTQPVGRTQILVRLHSGNFNFSTVKDDGSDLRFVAGDDKTPLAFHIARFDPLVDQVALIWVDVPDLAPGGATPLFLYWGNKNAPPGGDPHATYDPDQLLVWHFGDENGLPKDSTANALNALTGGKRDETGITGFALKLDGTAPVQLPNMPALAIAAGQSATWSVWVRVEDATNTAALFSARDATNALGLGMDKGVAYAELTTPSGTQRTTPGQPMAGGAWHLVTLIADGQKLSVYVDGAAQGDLAAALPAIAAGQALLGGAGAAPAAPPSPAAAAPPTPTLPADPNAAAAPAAPPQAAPAAPNFSGLLDEFQISKVARPVGAVQVAVHAQGPQANLLTLEQPEESSAFGTGYLGIILRSVTPDAWVVIGILAVMFFISWVVMLGKAIYVTRQGSANRLFRQELLRAESADEQGHTVTLSDTAHPALKRSSLFRIWRVGTDELASRVARGRLRAGEPVPAASLGAIRTALDAVYVRETRRLNNLMVLLTIAIAGGPFIGLLGTVIGVMITFAAIAAAGDVNVNAIAPGISAALLATVAGLTVAIPALFGYNYFTIRIRDATSEMQVFIEELIARFGEGAHPQHVPLPQPEPQPRPTPRPAPPSPASSSNPGSGNPALVPMAGE